MIRANFKLRLGDLDIDFVEKLKSLFSKNNVIEINIGDEVDETDYLLSTPANRESIFRSLEQLKNRQLISKQINHLETWFTLTAEAWKDYLYWQNTDKNILRKINDLLKDCLRDPFRGLGKPEPLKGKLMGFWSRRINNEHRLVYKYEGGELFIISCRFHYE